jgi:TonB family protein
VAWRGLWGAVALAVGLAGVAVPLSAGPKSKGDQPLWVKKPDEATLSQHYPVRAQFRNTDGRAVIECRVLADGNLSACVVIEQTPIDFGFGDAALSLARHFQLAKYTPAGKLTAGIKIRIPLRFNAKAKPKPPEPTTKPKSVPGPSSFL